MRSCIAVGCLVGVLVLAAFPGAITAQDAKSAATGLEISNSRDLLVVDSKSATEKAAVKPSNSESSQKESSNHEDGTTKVSVGADLIVLDDIPQPKDGQKPGSKPQAAAASYPQMGRKKQQQMAAAQQMTNARRRGRKHSALGRKGGKSGLRQAAGPGAAPLDYSFPDDYILPGCRPGLGVICADNDMLGLLKAEPAEINLDNAYPFFEVTPSAGFVGDTTTTADLGADQYKTETTAKTSTGLGVIAGTEQLTGNTDTTTTLDSTTVDASRIDRVLPDKVSTTVDSTAADGTYEWKTLHPVYTYVVGQNWGFPNGLATVTDGITGRKK